MKKFSFLIAASFLIMSAMAQGNSQAAKNKGQGKVKTQQKNKTVVNQTQGEVWTGTQGNVQQGKQSKNQPAKVREAFYRDYPNAGAVTWSKYRGDWTATFGNGPFRSTAVYHANGQRKDTRTPIGRQNLPGTIWDDIFRRNRVTPVGEYVQIERPGSLGNIFRIAVSQLSGQRAYQYYDVNGNLVKYDY